MYFCDTNTINFACIFENHFFGNMNKKPIKQKLSDFEMNSENPYAKQALVNIGNAIVSKSVKGSNKDESAILKAVDGNGEILGNSVFIRNKTVDSESFAKFFIAGFKAFFDLKPTSIKVFKFILEQLRPNRDDFLFFMDDCIKETGCSQASIFRALGDLCRAEIIARGRTEEQYYINPMCVFNGDRVTFATTYINANYPKYETTANRLKGAIDSMASDGILPSSESKKERKIVTGDLFESVDYQEEGENEYQTN